MSKPTGAAAEASTSPDRRWTLRGEHTEYTGPHGVSGGPSPVSYDGPTPFLTAGDFAPVEYATDAIRPFAGADLIAELPTGARRVSWSMHDATGDDSQLRVTFADAVMTCPAIAVGVC